MGIHSTEAIIHEEKLSDLALTEAPRHATNGHDGNNSLGDEHASFKAVDSVILARTRVR